MTKFQPLLSAMIILVVGIASRIRASEPSGPVLRRSNSAGDRSEWSPVLTRSRSAPSNPYDPVFTRSRSVLQTKFDSISCFEGLEDFYLSARRGQKIEQAMCSLRAEVLPTLQKDQQTKWSICKSIFYQSQYAEMCGGRLIDPGTTKNELKQYNRNIFVDNFEKRWSMAARGPWRRSRFVNKSISRTVSVGGNTYHETTFTCVLQKLNSRTVFKQFFVSEDEYNVNEVPGKDHIAGRFVFVDNADRNLIVHALAEEPAILPILATSELEWLYLKRRRKHSPTVESKTDPVCGLDRSRKIRLCNALSSKFRLWWQFKVVIEACKKRTVLFELDEVIMRAGQKPYSEWMITCKIVRRERSTITYYVSRAYEDNEVFIFGNEMNLQYHGRRVSVVSDNVLPEIPEVDDEEVV